MQRLLNPEAELIETSEEVTVYPNFDSMKLREDLLKGFLQLFRIISVQVFMAMGLISLLLCNKELFCQ